MEFIEQKIKGVFLIEPKLIGDERGKFRRHFCVEEMAAVGINTNVLQCNVSENVKKHTLRGIHYQVGPEAEDKTISCIKGALYDIVVDLRKDSPTYMEWVAFEINDQNKNMIHVPAGCANAFMTMEDNSIIHYYPSQMYTPNAERGIRYNDPAFDFRFPAEPAVISDKDMAHPDYIV